MGNNLIHISQVTALCESCQELLELPETVLTETDKKIGQMIADEVPNGATLQLGIGGVPNAVGVLLRDKKDLGLHKGVHNYLKRQKHVASFRLGEFGEGDAGVTIVEFKK